MNTNTPINGSEGNYTDPYPQDSIDSMQAKVDNQRAVVAANGPTAPKMNDPSGKTAVQWWDAKYLLSSYQLSLRKKKAKAGL